MFISFYYLNLSMPHPFFGFYQEICVKLLTRGHLSRTLRNEFDPHPICNSGKRLRL
jgi:hypothetical protein